MSCAPAKTPCTDKPCTDKCDHTFFGFCMLLSRLASQHDLDGIPEARGLMRLVMSRDARRTKWLPLLFT